MTYYYGFQVAATVDKWRQGSDAHERDANAESSRFMREVRVSAAVSDPGDVVTQPEDDPKTPPGGNGPGDSPDPDRWLLILILVFVLIGLLLQWPCCRKRPGRGPSVTSA